MGVLFPDLNVEYYRLLPLHSILFTTTLKARILSKRMLGEDEISKNSHGTPSILHMPKSPHLGIAYFLTRLTG